MNILLINTPSRKGNNGFFLPIALLCVGSILEKEGHQVKIYDPYLENFDLSDFDLGRLNTLQKLLNDFKPSIIGYGGIATSYGRVKRLAQFIKGNYPEILQIAGGPLASVYELLLTKTPVAIVFHGETEVSLPVFLTEYARKGSYLNVPGISYLLNGNITKNDPPEQIADLDTIPFPAYHLVEVKKYLRTLDNWNKPWDLLIKDNNYYSDIFKKNDKDFIEFLTSRGCTHTCLFCYRHMKGVRRHSVSYVIKHIKYLKKNYGIAGFQIGDELFNSHPQWVFDFCDSLQKEKLDIFYMVGGARVDRIDERMLRRLKETGCIEVAYGQESGSDTILKEYRKGFTAEQNKTATLLTTHLDMACPVQIVIGSPSENNHTIRETIQFLKSVHAYRYSLNYLIPLPQTPIWEYVVKNNIIQDVEMYLDKIAEYGGLPVVNLTKAPDRIWRTWYIRVRKELELYYYRKENHTFLYMKKLLYYNLLHLTVFLLPFPVFYRLKAILKKCADSIRPPTCPKLKR